MRAITRTRGGFFWVFLGGVLSGLAARGDVPRAEHPMPQMVRAEWLNLNGEWEFAETDDDAAAFVAGEPFPDKIIIPFCRESKRSGLARRGFVKNVWYRRSFSAPAEWKSPRIRLHVGACDWRTRVFVNGKGVGTHTGGSAPFAFDITSALQPGGNTVVIHAYDDTRSGLQACGKQSQKLESHGCLYTRTTGIWQTVWLEGVGETYIRDYQAVPTGDGHVQVRVEVDGPDAGIEVRVETFAGDKSVGAAAGPANDNSAALDIALSEKRLWTLEEPFLYDLKLSLVKEDKVIDSLQSYFGLRTVSIEGAAYLINGRPIFQRLVLDQGFYPDGIWTAPSDEALRRDIELSKAAGFNGARLHQKVFEPRFLYWADKLGYLVWGEFPNWGANVGAHKVDLPIIDEWVEILRRDRNHPAIIGWCPFNETPPSAGPTQNTIVYITRQIDPTRPALDSSGYHHGLPDPQLLDAHDYNQDPVTFRDKWFNAFGENTLPAQYGSLCGRFVPFFVSEYGGIGWSLDENAWGYGNTPKSLDEFYARFKGLTDALLDNPRMFGYCYTQLTNIEQEQNGIYLYDRTPKFDIEKIRAIQSRTAEYEKHPPIALPERNASWAVLVGAHPDGALAKAWKYTTKKPGEGWFRPDYDDASWGDGLGGFGKKGGWEDKTRTEWATKDIWLRQAFNFDGRAFEKAILVVHYDNGTQAYVNGQQIWTGEGWNNDYAAFDVTVPLKAALKQGKNVIAIHCRRDDRGQFIDTALLIR